jgi:hypothetical protein
MVCSVTLFKNFNVLSIFATLLAISCDSCCVLPSYCCFPLPDALVEKLGKEYREISQNVLGKKQPGHHAPMNAAQFDPKRQDMATLGKMIPQDNIWWAVAHNSRAVWPRVTMSCLFGSNWGVFIGAWCPNPSQD